MINLILRLEECEAEELHSLLQFWFEKDESLSKLIMEATREVAEVSKLVLMKRLGVEDKPEDVVVLGNMSGTRGVVFQFGEDETIVDVLGVGDGEA